jgi:flagellar biosynthesis protein FlhG
MPLDDVARARLDRPPTAVMRSGSLGRVTVFESGRWHAPIDARPAPRLFAVHGRSGVGTSTVAANLAVAFAGLGTRVILLDLNLRRPALHRLLGVSARAGGLETLMGAHVDTIEEVLTPTGVKNLYLISAVGSAARWEPASPVEQHRLLDQVWELAGNVVIADLGNGPADEIADLGAVGAIRLSVQAPDPRSVRQGYGLFRRELLRAIVDRVGGTTEGAMVAACLKDPAPPRMNELLALATGQPEMRAALEQAAAAVSGRIIGNRARNPDEADLFFAASRMLSDYLGLTIPVLGILDASDQLEACDSRRPLLLGPGIDRNVRLFHTMAEQLLSDAETAARVPAELDAPTAAPAQAPASPCLDARTACFRGGDEDDPPLPAPLSAFLRSHPRFPVDWLATFRSDAGRITAVRVYEVSMVGACMETLPELAAGDRGSLTFHQLGGEPTVRIIVQGVRPLLGRAGVRIEDPSEVGAAIAAAAAVAAASSR